MFLTTKCVHVKSIGLKSYRVNGMGVSASKKDTLITSNFVTKNGRVIETAEGKIFNSYE